MPRTATRQQLLAIALAAAWVTGCAPANRDQLAKEVLQADPEFSSVLEKREHLMNRIEERKRKLEIKRNTIDEGIAQLRRDLASATAMTRKEITLIEEQMKPDHERIQLALSLASEELRAKRQERATLGRQIAQLRKAAKNTGAQWTAEEHAAHEAELAAMLEDAGRLDQEMVGMKGHLRLLKIKMVLIRLR